MNRRQPKLVGIIRRLTDLEAAAFLTPAEMRELNDLRIELGEGWPEVAGARAAAYLETASRG